MIKRVFTLSVLFAASVVAAFAQMLSPRASMQLDTSVVYGKLENGLTYYIKHNEKPAQRADFYIVTHVGAIQETPAQDGLAHFLEHMCLNGTKNFPGKGIISYMESIGAKFGENINAWTSVESTAYMLNNIPVVREGIIDSSLLILHDYSAYVTNDFGEIEKERGVILEEKRTRNDAQWRYRDAAYGALYRGSKYASCSLIGSEENLKNFNPQELVDFYKTWYRPDLQAIIVVGDVDVKSVEKKIKDLFGTLPKAGNPKAKEVIEIPSNEKPIVSIFTDKENSRSGVEVYFKTGITPREYRGLGMYALMNIYKDLVSLMLNERFADIATRADAPFMGANGGFASLCETMDAFYTSAQCRDDAPVEALEAVFVELERIRRYGFTQAELDRAKSKLLKRYEMSAANASGRQNGYIVNDYMNHFIYGLPYMEPEYEYSVIKNYINSPAVNSDAVFALINGMFGDENMIVLFSGPQKESAVTPTEEQLLEAIARARVADIKPLAEESVNEPLLDAASLKGSSVVAQESVEFGATRLELANGIEIYIKPTEFKKDEVFIKCVSTGGKSVLDTELLPSLERNVVMFLQAYQGVAEFPVAKLKKMLTGKAASVVPYIERVNQGLDAAGSPKDIETILQLIYLNYAAPRFEKSEMEVGLNQLKAILPNMLVQPDFINNNVMYETMYGNSPRVPILTPELLEKVSVDNYRKAYEQLFSDAAGLKVYITGNVDIDAIKPLLEKYIGSLPVKSEAGKMWADDECDIVKGKVENVFEVSMEAPKTKATLVYSADMKRTLKNEILGDALQYILNMTYTKTIREDEGGTYGVGVIVQSWAQPKEGMLLLVTFDTEYAKSGKLIDIAIQGVEDIAMSGVSEEYVAKARESMLKALPEKRIKNSYWMNALYNMYSMGHDVVTEYEECVKESVSSKEIQKYVKQILKQGNFIKLVMNPI